MLALDFAEGRCEWNVQRNDCFFYKQVLDILTPIVQDSKSPIDLAGFAAVALGLVYVGSCNEVVAQSIFVALMERSEADLGEPLARFLCLGLGLLYLGKQVCSVVRVFDASFWTLKLSKSHNLVAYIGFISPDIKL